MYARGTDLNLVRRRIGMVFQQPNPFPMSIFENVAFAIREQARRARAASQLESAVAAGAASAPGCGTRSRTRCSRNALTLSGGQQQRLCIARTLAATPEIVLMDEPCSALDPRSTAKIEELIVALRDVMTVVIVTHNLAQADASPTTCRCASTAWSSRPGAARWCSRSRRGPRRATTSPACSDEARGRAVAAAALTLLVATTVHGV